MGLISDHPRVVKGVSRTHYNFPIRQYDVRGPCDHLIFSEIYVAALNLFLAESF